MVDCAIVREFKPDKLKFGAVKTPSTVKSFETLILVALIFEVDTELLDTELLDTELVEISETFNIPLMFVFTFKSILLL